MSSAKGLQEYGWGVKVVSLGLVLLLLFVLLEGGSRLLYAFKDNLKQVARLSPTLELHEYQRLDPNHPGNYLLKPGFSETLGQSLRIKQEGGRVLGLKYLQERAPILQVTEDTVLFRINADGFIGPEIDRQHSKIRILTIGDSCTFGSPFNAYSYPRTLERELNQGGQECRSSECRSGRIRTRKRQLPNRGIQGAASGDYHHLPGLERPL